MNYTKEQLIDALCNEYDYLIHDDYNPDEDHTSEEYRGSLECLTLEELLEETNTDEEYSLEEFMETYLKE